MSGPGPRVEVYVTPGCHLCDDAGAIVDRVCGDLGVGWVQTELAALEPATAAQWRDFVPVILVDGDVHDLFRVDAGRLREALGAAAPAGRV